MRELAPLPSRPLRPNLALSRRSADHLGDRRALADLPGDRSSIRLPRHRLCRRRRRIADALRLDELALKAEKIRRFVTAPSSADTRREWANFIKEPCNDPRRSARRRAARNPRLSEINRRAPSTISRRGTIISGVQARMMPVMSEAFLLSLQHECARATARGTDQEAILTGASAVIGTLILNLLNSMSPPGRSPRDAGARLRKGDARRRRRHNGDGPGASDRK